MRTSAKGLLTLTAGDLMTRDVVLLPEAMPLRAAARLLVENHIGGAPVVDAQGKCIGVLSAVDFLQQAAKPADAPRPARPRRAVTCAFQAKHRRADGQEVTLCTLPPGVCPVQVKQTEPNGQELLICTEPNCVLADWQVVELEKLPDDEVARFMTADPVTVTPETPIRRLARLMIDAHIHRVIVVDKQQKPVGIVSSTDVLAAVAYAEAE